MSVAVADDLLELVFDAGLPGFPDVRRFAIVGLGEDNPFAIMRCIEEDGPEFVVVPPATFFPDYAPELDDPIAADLELHDADDAILLVIVNVSGGIADATANLLGPIVINRHTRRAAQVILSGSPNEPRTPLRS